MPHVSTCRSQPFLVRGGALDVVLEGSQISPCKTFVCPRRVGVITYKILSRESGSIEEKMGMSGSVNSQFFRHGPSSADQAQIFSRSERLTGGRRGIWPSMRLEAARSTHWICRRIKSPSTTWPRESGTWSRSLRPVVVTRVTGESSRECR